MDQQLQYQQVGPLATSTSLPNGTQVVLRAGQMGDNIVSQLQSKNYENCYRRNRFFAANQAAATTTVGLATTYTGLVLSNPNGSGVNLVLERIGYSFIVAFPAGAAVGLMAGYSATDVTHTTPSTTLASSYIGSGVAPKAKVDTSATLPVAPVVQTLLASGLTGAITTTPLLNHGTVDIDGGIILPPGAFIAFYTSTVSGTSGFLGSFAWTEVPV